MIHPLVEMPVKGRKLEADGRTRIGQLVSVTR
jgi:hypothetical protein